MANPLVFFRGNDMVVELDALKDAIANTFANAATVTFTLFDRADDSIIQGPTTMAYVSASDGKYQGTVEDSLSLSIGKNYYIEVDADAGSDDIAKWRLQVDVKHRT